MEKTLICVIGPTAIGKTRLAISLAQHYQAPILSADSRQFFKEMAIGTAVPTAEEQQAATHHFIQHISIEESYSVGDFERDALALLDTVFKEHSIAIMVGGSGLYVDAVVNGLDDFPEVDPKIREELTHLLETEGKEALQQLLLEKDPVQHAKVDLDNPHRLIRALEVCLHTGKPYSSFLDRPKPKRLFRSLMVGLEADREILYQRINTRVDLMMEEGLLEEARKVYPQKHLNALQTVGYRELFTHFDGDCTLEDAVSEIKKNTRRFAKRQLTWFRKTKDAHWFAYDTDPQTILKRIDTLLEPKPIFYVMGVSGSGKSTVGKLLSQTLGVPFFDGDDFHPKENVAKMASGHPLNDEDRKGWLEALNQQAKSQLATGAVIGCSALKEKYRKMLEDGLEGHVVWVYLEGSYDFIMERMSKRTDHFMPPSLLKSQFEALEPPKNALTLSIAKSPEAIVAEVMDTYKTKKGAPN